MRKLTTIILFMMGLLCAKGSDMKVLYESALGVYKTQPLDSAKVAAENYLKVVRESNDGFYQLKGYFLLAYICSKTEEFGDAVIYYLEAARIGEGLEENSEVKQQLISVYMNLSVILGNYKHYELAFKFNGQGLELALSLNDSTQFIDLSLNRIGDLLEEKKYNQALNAIDSLMVHFASSMSLESLVWLKNKQGIAYKNLGQYDLAKATYQFILDQGVVDEKVYSYALHNIGTLHFKKGQINMALKFYKEEVSFLREYHLSKELVYSLKDLAEAYYVSGNSGLALKYLKEAEQIDREEYTHTPDNHELYKLTSEVYGALGNMPLALEYERIYTQKLEGFIAEQRRIAELDKKHNIQLLTERYFDLQAFSDKQKASKQMAQLGLAGSAILLGVILMFWWRQHHIRSSIRKELRDIEAFSNV